MELQHLEDALGEKIGSQSARTHQPSLEQQERRRNLFGRQMCQERKRKGISELELGNAIGFTENQIKALESGEKATLHTSIEKMEAITHHLGCSLKIDPVPPHVGNGTTLSILITYAATTRKKLTLTFVPKES